MVLVRIPFAAAARAGAIQLLADYKTDAGINLNIYKGRPKAITLPQAFVDSLNETHGDYFATQRQRQISVEVVVLLGVFDYGNTVEQRDEFADGFSDWVTDRYHAFGGNTLVQVASIDDVPFYEPDWMPGGERKQYFGVRIVLEGLATT